MIASGDIRGHIDWAELMESMRQTARALADALDGLEFGSVLQVDPPEGMDRLSFHLRRGEPVVFERG
jgi:hypothetical protein